MTCNSDDAASKCLHTQTHQLPNGCHHPARLEALLSILYFYLFFFFNDFSPNDGSQIPLGTSRLALPARINRWLRPRHRNLRASILGGGALAHSIHVGSARPCSRCGPRMGRRRPLFKGRGQRIKDGGVGEGGDARPDSPFGRFGCAVRRSVPAGQDSRRGGVTMAASLASTDPLRLPDATMNSCSRTQAPPTKRPRGGPTCACPLHGPGGRGARAGASVSRNRANTC